MARNVSTREVRESSVKNTGETIILYPHTRVGEATVPRTVQPLNTFDLGKSTLTTTNAAENARGSLLTV